MILASTLAACGAALQINVLPFNPVHDFTLSYRDLAIKYNVDGFVGATVARPVAELKDCVLSVGFRDPVVYVVKELTANRCAFDTVLVHEHRHVSIYQWHLTTLAARIRARLGEEDVKSMLNQELDSTLPDHRAHDNPQEYARNRKDCSGAIFKLTEGNH
jgi:hypothetical protein